MCWICLEEASENGSHQLVSPCKCPRKVHPQCLARWQLQQAGRHEEKFCRFVCLSGVLGLVQCNTLPPTVPCNDSSSINAQNTSAQLRCAPQKLHSHF